MKWRIYYGDGSIVSDKEVDIEAIPTRNVQVILQIDERTGWYMQTGSDYYVWRIDRWVGVDTFGLFDYLMSDGWKRVLMGRTISTKEYKALFEQAERDKSLPNKSAFISGETRPE